MITAVTSGAYKQHFPFSYLNKSKNKEDGPYGPAEVPLPREEAVLKRARKAFSDMKYPIFAFCILHFMLKKRSNIKARITDAIGKQGAVEEGFARGKVK